MQGVPRPSPTDLPDVTSLFFFARAQARRPDATSRATTAARRLVKSLGQGSFLCRRDGSRRAIVLMVTPRRERERELRVGELRL